MEKCLECGKELIQVPGKRAKKFCNETCRSNNWQKNQRLKKALENKGGKPIITDAPLEFLPIPSLVEGTTEHPGGPTSEPAQTRQLIRRPLPEPMPAGLSIIGQNIWRAEQRKKAQEINKLK